MSTTTPNFGWQVPTSTDFVKDGATAIETLGDAIDASLVDLKGGTTGQVLSKNSNTDMDFIWVTKDGDITEVTAGTGISGGGTTGAVTITNTMATAIDAKGDLVAGTGADAFARVAVGTNGQVLTADSSIATGMKWATPSGDLNVQVFNATGTFTVPAGKRYFDVICIAGGGGGGSGRGTTTGSGLAPGQGGVGGQMVGIIGLDLNGVSTVTVTVGGGGTGGAGVVPSGTVDGNPGTNGNNTTFGSYLTAVGGTFGNKGTPSQSVQSNSPISAMIGYDGQPNTVGNLTSAGPSTPAAIKALSGIQTLPTGANGANATSSGGSGGSGWCGAGGAGAGTFNPYAAYTAGSGNNGGGGGGGSGNGVTGGAGGAGAANSGGGGGGGGTTYNATTGAGGNGGSGVVVVMWR